jgi:adenosyl cobinamide kinase/adenosyl cobinamide phosphate guanylyltransferase
VLTLVLGGTRSGKSAVAEQLAVEAASASGAPVTYVATGTPTDEAMAGRIAAHRARRPADWATLEVVDPALLLPAVGALEGVVLLDSLGSWVASSPELQVDGVALAEVLQTRSGQTVVVSEEVGLSLHAPTEVGRAFVDALGALNQAVAAVADRALLVVAGRVLDL